MKLNYYKKYFQTLRNVISFSRNNLEKLIKIENLILKAKKNKKKIIIFGNGGSAAIASHFTIDCINKIKMKCINFSDASILTCFSNDYGYENWVKKSLEQFVDKGDLVILISSSGESKNMLLGCKFLKKKKIKSITFTGFKENNSLRKNGDINIWIDSKIYNFIENSHQLLLLSLTDSISNTKIK